MNTTQETKTEVRAARRDEQIRDRRAYRDILIYRREQIEAKIAKIEQQISDLRPDAT